MAKLKLTKQKIQKVIPECNGVKKYLAEKLGVDVRTIYRYFEKHPDLEQETKEYLDSVSDVAEHHLIEAVKVGNSWAVRYWLSTRGKHRGYSTKQEAIFNGMFPVQKITEGVADNENDGGNSYEKN